MASVIEITATLDNETDAGTSQIVRNLKEVESQSSIATTGFTSLQTIGTAALAGVAAVAVGAVAAIGGIAIAAFDLADDTATATADISAEYGLIGDEAIAMGELAQEVWGNNFAGSVTEAGDAMGYAYQQLGLVDDALVNATEDAFRLSDVFEVDTVEGINTANVLMEEFGLTSDQAFDFIAKGFQSGLNSSDDFIDSIGEYSNLFADAGFDADDFFSIMETGAAGGVLGTDKIADAIKEMGIILSEGGDKAKAAFSDIGLNFDQIAASVAAGDETWADYFPNIIEGLNSIEDPIKKQQAQVAIFGTMAEDLGVSFTEGLSTATTSLEEMAGATDSLDAKYDTLGSAVEGFKRRGLLAFEPIGTIILNLANSILPHLEGAFAFLETTVAPAIETVAAVIQSFIANLSEGMTPLDAFVEAIWSIASPEVLAFLVQLRDEILPSLVEWFMANVQPILTMVASFVSWQDVLAVLAGVVVGLVIPAIVSMVVALAPILLAIGAAIAIVALMRTAWENDWGGIQEKVATVIAFVQGVITSVMTAIQVFWAANGQAILAKASEVWTAIQTAVQTAIATAQKIIMTIMPVIVEYLGGIWDTIMLVFAAFKSAFEGDWEAFGATLREAWETYWTAVVNFLDQLWGMIQPKLAAAWESIKAWWGGIDWVSLGQNITDGIVNGLGDLVGRVTGALGDAAAAAQAAWNGFWDSHSPSRWMIESMGNVIDGAVIGLGDGRELMKQSEAIATRVAQPFSGLQITPQFATAGGFGAGGFRGNPLAEETLPPPVTSSTKEGRMSNYYDSQFIFPNVTDHEGMIRALEENEQAG